MMTLMIKRETLDDAMTLQGHTLGAVGVLEDLRDKIRQGKRVIVEEYGGSESLLTVDAEGKFKSTVIAPK